MTSPVRKLYRRLGGPQARLFIASWRLRARGSWVKNPAGHRLYVRPSDPRAQAMALRRGALDARAIAAWAQVCELIDPTVVIDVGANYGEVALSRRYGPSVQLHVVEANPLVCDALRRTIQELGDADVRLHAVAAGHEDGEALLHTSSRSSGLSSVVRSVEAEDATVSVPMMRVDSIIRATPEDRIAFKVDVEGFEYEVLCGMSGLLAGRHFVGLVELPSSGPERDRLVNLIVERFSVRRIDLVGRWQPVGVDDLADRYPDRFTKDLVLLPLGDPDPLA